MTVHPRRRGGRAPRTLALLTLLAALTPLAAAGCGGDPPAVVPAASTSAPPGTDLTLPLDPYLLTLAQIRQVSDAHRAMAAACLGRFGLTPPPSRPTQDGRLDLNERRYGITNLATAMVAGYRLSADAATASPAASSTAADSTMLGVLNGEGPTTVRGRQVPDGGCHGEAVRLLNADAPAAADMLLAQRLSQESFQRSQLDDRVKAALADWSRCMRTRGLEYPTPLAAAADPAFRGTVSAKEIATAEADIGCKRQTDMVGVWHTVESDIQRAQVASNRAALDLIRQTNEAQLAVARDLGPG